MASPMFHTCFDHPAQLCLRCANPGGVCALCGFAWGQHSSEGLYCPEMIGGYLFGFRNNQSFTEGYQC